MAEDKQDTQPIKVATLQVRWFFFTIGLVALLAYRSIIVLNNFGQRWVAIAWYLGTISFVIYYFHRYQISKKRLAIIRRYQLDAKVELLDVLGVRDKEALHYLLESLESSKERWNYFFTFALTAVALVVGIIVDLVKLFK